jgi:Tfp pilus assembly protein PilN
VIDFRLNLIRDQVPSRLQRRLRYRALIAYLALTGLLLVGAVSLASTRWLERAGVRGNIDQIERFYQSGHEGQGDLMSGVARLQEKFQAQVAGLQATESLLLTDPRPARLIRSLLVTLPPSVSLRNFKLIREDGSLQFELLSVGGTDVSPAELIILWQKDLVVKAALKDLTFQGSQIENAGGRSDTVWRFSGRLNGGT